MTLRVPGDPKGVEATDPAILQTVVDRGKAMGCLAHHFYGNGTEVLVIDEWPDEESFRKFFDASPEIKGVMDNAGVTSAPTIEFWRALDTSDGFG
ncbi:hypothetical protein [Nocardioides sp.]|uniref:hypothetical protein n=1 Tax=Nocardioides sp. TaxID=35761 RepID=UPI0031FF1285|nr:hypothetical protein [Nocardioides sp.]